MRLPRTKHPFNPNNTKVYINSGHIEVYLHGHRIVTVGHAGIALNTCGWWTRTTMRRMNEVLEWLGRSERVKRLHMTWVLVAESGFQKWPVLGTICCIPSDPNNNDLDINPPDVIKSLL